MTVNGKNVEVRARRPWSGSHGDNEHDVKGTFGPVTMGEIAICISCPQKTCSGSCDTIIKYRRENKSDQNERCIRAKKIPNDFEDRVNAGIGTAELAKLYRVGTSTVYRWKKKLGLVNTNLGRKSKQHGV